MSRIIAQIAPKTRENKIKNKIKYKKEKEKEKEKENECSSSDEATIQMTLDHHQ